MGKPSLAARFPQLVAELTAPAEHGGHLGVNRYLHEVWSRRPDLRERWPELDGPGGAWLVDWAYRYGFDEVPIPEELLPARAFDETPTGVNQYLHGAWLRRPDLQAAFPRLDRDAAALVEWARRDGRREDPGLAAWLDGAPTRVRPEAQRRREGPRGVNVVGGVSPELGLSRAAQLAISGLDARGVPLLEAAQIAGARFPIDLLCLNPRELWRFVRSDELPGYRIGWWWWEIPGALPVEWWVGFELVDEVWAGSDAVAQALETMSPLPVVRVTLPVERPPAPRLTRAELGLPAGFLFLLAFDHESNFERKNPLAAVEAFRAAFPRPRQASLVVKCVNSRSRPDDHRRLLAAAARHPDVHVIDGLLPPERHRALFAACDCYVSLHRGEGFGLTLAEAMALGKPAIATGWSGNLEYMTDENSYLVGHRLVRVGDADPNYYPREAWWADPDARDAVAAMRRVVERPDEAAARGARAAADLERVHAPAVAGRTLERRLDEIARRRSGKPWWRKLVYSRS